MTAPLTFYTHPMSRGRVARWMLEETGLPYDTVLLDYGTTMKAPEYCAINPMGDLYKTQVRELAEPLGFGFLGLYIVAEPYRGQGYGLALWQRAMDRLAGKNIGLDGVVAQQENYKKSGFRLAHRNLRYQGIIPAGPELPPDIAAGESQAFPALLAYDTRHFPEPRQAFLAAWLSAPEHCSLVCRRDGQVRGYGVIRRCLQGYKIGPLFADDSEIAQGLFQGLAALADQEPVFLDISETNKEALALCQAQGMTAQFETARMYTGPTPDLPWDQVYGITTFELG